jgi:anion-transporting  ArsA/GET3 family ATPase
VIDVLARSRLIVTVGTGGVGKTTIAAALGIAAARRGRRALVLTIDPARALAAALGLDGLAADGEPVPAAALAGAGLALPVPLDAAMLDQRAAWDAFVRRHAPTPAHAAALLGNRVYQALSTSFAGSTEYMALEEMSRHVDSGRYDLVIVDTPPAAHALDFVSAPDRIAPLVERGVVAALARPAGAAGTLARFVARRIEGATGARTLAELATFFAALEALVDAAAARARHARAMLRAPGTAFVLVAAARACAAGRDRRAGAASMAAAAAPLAAVVAQPRPAAGGRGGGHRAGARRADRRADPGLDVRDLGRRRRRCRRRARGAGAAGERGAGPAGGRGDRAASRSAAAARARRDRRSAERDAQRHGDLRVISRPHRARSYARSRRDSSSSDRRSRRVRCDKLSQLPVAIGGRRVRIRETGNASDATPSGGTATKHSRYPRARHGFQA